ncbi:MAG: VWA domain-containing protein [Acidobacteriota bacterium]|nr:VWA domain-containing protein [Acidobacteriota bacterium]
MRVSWSLALFLTGALALAAPLAGQSQRPTGPVHVKPGQTAPAPLPKQQQQQQKPLQFRVNVVRVPVTVRAPDGHLALDLGPEDFQVYDDGALQHIAHFDVGGEPMAVVLVIDGSARVTPLMAGIRKMGILFTETVLGANGEGAVISFDGTSKLLVPFSFDHNRIQKVVEDLKPGDDGSHLYDALYRAVRMLENAPPNRRRVIVAVSESVDTGSETKLETVLRDAQLANISMYSIGLSSTAAQLRAAPSQATGPTFGPPGTFSRPGIPGSPQTPITSAESSSNVDLLPLVEDLVKMGINLITPQALEAASAATGGDHINTYHDNSIQQAMYRIGEELHAEYTLAYDAPPEGPWTWHEITVKVMRPGFKVRTRPGYFLSPPNGSTTSSNN